MKSYNIQKLGHGAFNFSSSPIMHLLVRFDDPSLNWQNFNRKLFNVSFEMTMSFRPLFYGNDVNKFNSTKGPHYCSNLPTDSLQKRKQLLYKTNSFI